MDELQEKELLLLVFRLFNEAKPVAKWLDFTNFHKLLFVKLAQSHQNPSLLVRVDTSHEADLQLVPESVRVLDQIAIFESRCLRFYLKKTRQIVPSNEVVLS